MAARHASHNLFVRPEQQPAGGGSRSVRLDSPIVKQSGLARLLDGQDAAKLFRVRSLSRSRLGLRDLKTKRPQLERGYSFLLYSAWTSSQARTRYRQIGPFKLPSSRNTTRRVKAMPLLPIAFASIRNTMGPRGLAPSTNTPESRMVFAITAASTAGLAYFSQICCSKPIVK